MATNDTQPDPSTPSAPVSSVIPPPSSAIRDQASPRPACSAGPLLTWFMTGTTLVVVLVIWLAGHTTDQRPQVVSRPTDAAPARTASGPLPSNWPSGSLAGKDSAVAKATAPPGGRRRRANPAHQHEREHRGGRRPETRGAKPLCRQRRLQPAPGGRPAANRTRGIGRICRRGRASAPGAHVRPGAVQLGRAQRSACDARASGSCRARLPCVPAAPTMQALAPAAAPAGHLVMADEAYRRVSQPVTRPPAAGPGRSMAPNA